MKVMFFNNGNTMVFDNQGQQVEECQEPWLRLYADFLASKDIDPTKVSFEMPNGRSVKVIKTDIGYNWVL